MSALAKLPPSIRGNASVQGLVSQLSTTRARSRELTKLADQVQSPVEQTIATQGGAAAHGAIMSFLGPKNGTLASAGLAVSAVLAGSVMEMPSAIAFGNGLLAPFVSLKVMELLQK